MSRAILTVTSDGYGKRTAITEYPTQARGGLGVINIKLREKSSVIAVLFVQDEDEILLVTTKGVVIRQSVSKIGLYSRSSKGILLQKLDDGDRIVTVQIAPKGAEDV